MSNEFTTVTSKTLTGSLVNRLRGVANRTRNIASRLGVRPYVVRIIRVSWTGSRRHRGQKQLLETLTILPTPKVTQYEALTDELTPLGRDTEGLLVVTGINPDFTEDQLRGIPAGQGKVPDDQEIYWEIEYPHEPGGSRKRRFLLAAVPYYNAERLEWVVGLVSAQPDRERNGALEALP